MPPVQILFLSADPLSYDPNLHPGDRAARLALDEDFRGIERALREAGRSHAVELVPRLAVRAGDLLQALNQLCPQAVHFSGHGSYGGVMLVDDDGGPLPVPADALAALLRAACASVRLVVLSACETSALAVKLAAAVGCAIGMEGEMPDESAIAFDSAFYGALACGKPVRQAFEQGKAAISVRGLEGAERPRLFYGEGVDPGELVLVPPAPGPEVPADRDEREHGGRPQVVTVTGDGAQVFMAGRDLNVSGGPGAPAAGERAGGVRSFTNVWYLPRRLRFYQRVNADVGTLIVHPDRLEFRGEKGSLTIGEIHDVAHTRHGGDISNSWVRVTYGDRAAPSEAWFSHRTRLGVDALLGGSAELFDVLHARMKAPAR